MDFFLTPDGRSGRKARKYLAQHAPGLHRIAGPWSALMAQAHATYLLPPSATTWSVKLGECLAQPFDSFWSGSYDVAPEETTDELNVALNNLIEGAGPYADWSSLIKQLPHPSRPHNRISELFRLLKQIDALPDSSQMMAELIGANHPPLRLLRVYHLADFPELNKWQEAVLAKLSTDAPPLDKNLQELLSRALGLKRLRKGNVSEYYETRWLHREGYEIWVEVRATLFENKGRSLILANLVDITNRKKAERQLKTSEKELQVKSIKLAETNTALKVLLEQQNEEKIELQENFVFNIEKLVLPYVSSLEEMLSRPRDLAYIQTIRSNLSDVVSPFLRKMASRFLKLTPKQIQVISLIRQGRLSKEIAEILGVSKAAIDFHRDEIRKKLGIKNTQVNLKSYLQILEGTTVPDGG